VTDAIRNKNVRVITAAVFCCVAAPAAWSATRPQIPVWDAATIDKVCARTLADSRALAASLAELPLAEISDARVYGDWDHLQILIEDTQGPVSLLANVSPNAAARAAAEACLLKFSVLGTELLQNAALYERIRRGVPADAIDSKLRKDLTEAFEDAGVALAPAKQARMKAILQRLEELRQAFDRNIRDNRTRVTFTPAELKGLPTSYLGKARRDGDGNFLLGFDYPEYDPFMANAENEAARKRYYIAFNNRGTEQNLVILAEASRLRLEIANLYGLPSYADFVARRRMAANPGTVHRFLKQVEEKVRDIERTEFDELRALKAFSLGGTSEQVTLHPWDLRYYREQLKRRRFSVDQEALRAYFPTDAMVKWALAISSDLYGIKFEAASPPVWHPSVRYYNVVDSSTGDFLGGIYLDLFPREGKYRHAAAFPVRSVSVAAKRTPISVLVANFNAKGLDHQEVETLLHEFGHVLHGALSQTRYASHAGTDVERDFVEAPSQMYEEWARKKESLQLVQQFCAGCPSVDDVLVARLRAAHLYGTGIRYARQHLYASYDMALAGERVLDPLQTWIAMESATPAGFVPATQFPGTFAHLLGGYAAGYYGYMWSEVLALDMLSVFGDNLMNPQVGRRFRKLILSQGGQEPASGLVRAFLGRDPSPDAFFAEITGRRGN